MEARSYHNELERNNKRLALLTQLSDTIGDIRSRSETKRESNVEEHKERLGSIRQYFQEEIQAFQNRAEELDTGLSTLREEVSELRDAVRSRFDGVEKDMVAAEPGRALHMSWLEAQIMRMRERRDQLTELIAELREKLKETQDQLQKEEENAPRLEEAASEAETRKETVRNAYLDIEKCIMSLHRVKEIKNNRAIFREVKQALQNVGEIVAPSDDSTQIWQELLQKTNTAVQEVEDLVQQRESLHQDLQEKKKKLHSIMQQFVDAKVRADEAHMEAREEGTGILCQANDSVNKFVEEIKSAANPVPTVTLRGDKSVMTERLERQIALYDDLLQQALSNQIPPSPSLSARSRRSSLSQSAKRRKRQSLYDLFTVAPQAQTKSTVVANNYDTAVDISGWKLEAPDVPEFVFPSVTNIEPGQSVSVWVGGDAAEFEGDGMDFFWTHEDVWDRSEVTLRDDKGRVAASWSNPKNNRVSCSVM